MKKSKYAEILYALLLMIAVQSVREGITQLIYRFYTPSVFGDKMITMLIMLALTPLIILLAKKTKTKLSVFPEHFGKSYIIFTVIAAALLISTPSNYTGGYTAVLSLIYGSVVTPVFEELIFRGYMWNKFEKVFKKPVAVYAVSVFMFMIWHIGYMIPNIIDGNMKAVLWKTAAGFGYGLILGALRLKTKNCYSTILLHGVLNNFMI